MEISALSMQRNVSLGRDEVLGAAKVAKGWLKHLSTLPSTPRILAVQAIFQSQILMAQKLYEQITPDLDPLKKTIKELSQQPFLSTKEYFELILVVRNLRTIEEEELALEVLEEMQARAEYVRGILRNPQLTLRLGGVIDHLFQSMANIYLHKGCEECVVQALKVREENKTRSVLSQLKGTSLNKRKVLTEETVYEKARARLVDLRGQGQNRSSKKEIEASLNFLNLKLGLHQGKPGTGDIFSKASFIPQHQPLPELDIESLQQKLDASTAIIIYHFSLEGCGAWVVSRNGILWKPLGSLNEIQQALIRYRTELLFTEPSWEKRFPKAAQDAYKVLLGPLAPDLLDKKHLVIIPDSSAFFVPFESLIIAEGPDAGKYLIEKYEVTYNYSLSLLDEVSQYSDLDRGLASEVLLMGNPDFGEHSLNGTRSGELRPLPGTKLEIEKILQVVGSGAVSVYLGEQAEENVLKKDISKFNIIHLATHGVVSKQYPWESYLAFSHDQILTLQEVSRLKLKSDLVVLSACDTGTGKFLEGEGVWGFQAGFLAAGSKNVLASLWPVDDESTAILMEGFYKDFVLNSKTYGEALRAAKLKMLQTKQWKHPYYWAPFVLYGSL